MGLSLRKHPNRVAIIAVLWGLVISAGVICHHLVIDRQLEAAASHFMTQAQLDRLIADQRAITESGVFPRSANLRDAGPLLNSYVKLDGGTVEQQTAVTQAWWGNDEVYTQTKRAKKRAKGWRRVAADQRPWLVAPETMPHGDLSMMKALLDYDYWETSSSPGRYAEYLATDHHPFSADSPIPNFIYLQGLARLRLAQGLTSSDGAAMLDALKETRHLARLTYSTESLVGSMVARALLSIEKRGYDQAVSRGLIQASDWTPASDAVRNAMRRVGFGTVMVLAGWTVPDDPLEQIAVAGVELFNHCGALNELTFQHHLLYPVWETLPGERSLNHIGPAVAVRLDQSDHCRVITSRQVMAEPERMSFADWRRGFESLTMSTSPKSPGSGFYWAVKVPFIRSHVLLDAVMRGTSIGMYRQYGSTSADDWSGP